MAGSRRTTMTMSDKTYEMIDWLKKSGETTTEIVRRAVNTLHFLTQETEKGREIVSCVRDQNGQITDVTRLVFVP